MNPYENLANAVVLQAVKDYRDAAGKLSRGKKNIMAEQRRKNRPKKKHPRVGVWRAEEEHTDA